MPNFVKQIKSRVNSILDRCYEFFKDVYRGTYKIPAPIWPAVRALSVHIVRLSLWIKDFPRVNQYRLVAQGWNLVFLGSSKGLAEVANLFFKNDCSKSLESRVAIWNFSSFASQQIQKNTHLVIIEHCPLLKKPNAKNVFHTPYQVYLSLSIPEDINMLLSGNHARGLRLRINRGQKLGYQIQVSRDHSSLDLFYNRMYLPFIFGRHGSLALRSPISFFQKAVMNGGLLLVCQNEQPLAGTVFTLRPMVCRAVEEGVLDNDPVLWQQGINVNVIWGLIQWAHQHGYPIIDMGSSHSWTSDGSYMMKTTWHARPVSPEVYPGWTFYLGTLASEQIARLNEIGFIILNRGKFYRVMLASQLGEEEMGKELALAKLQEISGIAVFESGQLTRFYETPGSAE